MRTRRAWLLLALGLVLLNASLASAREVRQGDQCVVAAEETIASNLFALCRTLVIEGTIDRNLVAAATTARISPTGRIAGSVYLLAGQLDIEGTVGQDIHFAGPVLTIHPSAQLEDEQGDLLSLSLSTTVLEDATIPGSITSVGYQLVLEGRAGNEVNFWGSGLRINGRVDGDLDAAVGDAQSQGVPPLQTLLIPFPFSVQLINPGLTIAEDAWLRGEVHYTGPSEAQIAEGARLINDPEYTPVARTPDFTHIIGEEEDGLRQIGLYLSEVVREFLTLSVIGVLGLLLTPRFLQAPLLQLRLQPLSSLGIGLLAFVLSFPILLIVFGLTLLLLVVFALLRLDNLAVVAGLLLGLVDVGGASLFYFVAIFVTRVIFCLAIGRGLARLVVGESSGQRGLYLSLFLGAALMALISTLPIVGWVVNAVAVFLGLGAMLLMFQMQLRAAREGVPPGRRPMASPAVFPRAEHPQFPPPMLDDDTRPRGMDNLPEGFTWWGEDDEEQGGG